MKLQNFYVQNVRTYFLNFENFVSRVVLQQMSDACLVVMGMDRLPF